MFKYLPNFGAIFGYTPVMNALPEGSGGSTDRDIDMTRKHKHDRYEDDHYYKHHDKHDDCEDKDPCEPPEIAVVGKVFSFCDHDPKDVKKFEDLIEEFHCKYPWVLFKWNKAYTNKYKCQIRYFVWFSLLDYEKAFELEAYLQKKYRKILMYN